MFADEELQKIVDRDMPGYVVVFDEAALGTKEHLRELREKYHGTKESLEELRKEYLESREPFSGMVKLRQSNSQRLQTVIFKDDKIVGAQG